MGVNGEALQLHAVHKKPYFLLQVTWESVSGTASHVRCIWTCNEIEGSYYKIIITIVPSYTRKSITHLLPLALLLVLHTRNNTDGNKFVIFSGIAWYYGDNYIYIQFTGTIICSILYNFWTLHLTCIVPLWYGKLFMHAYNFMPKFHLAVTIYIFHQRVKSLWEWYLQRTLHQVQVEGSFTWLSK